MCIFNCQSQLHTFHRLMKANGKCSMNEKKILKNLSKFYGIEIQLPNGSIIVIRPPLVQILKALDEFVKSNEQFISDEQKEQYNEIVAPQLDNLYRSNLSFDRIIAVIGFLLSVYSAISSFSSGQQAEQIIAQNKVIIQQNETQILQKEKELELQKSQIDLLQELIALIQSSENAGDNAFDAVNTFRKEGDNLCILSVDSNKSLIGDKQSNAANCLEADTDRQN